MSCSDAAECLPGAGMPLAAATSATATITPMIAREVRERERSSVRACAGRTGTGPVDSAVASRKSTPRNTAQDGRSVAGIPGPTSQHQPRAQSHQRSGAASLPGGRPERPRRCRAKNRQRTARATARQLATFSSARDSQDGLSAPSRTVEAIGREGSRRIVSAVPTPRRTALRTASWRLLRLQRHVTSGDRFGDIWMVWASAYPTAPRRVRRPADSCGR